MAAIFKLYLGKKVKLIRNDFIPNGKPTIFAAAHVFRNDIPAVLCSLQNAAHLLLGIDGVGNLASPIERCGLWMKGAITLKRGDKRSRAESFDKMVNILNHQGDLSVFPEAAWNFSPNVFVAKLNWGVMRAAEHTGANIVPVAVDIVGEDYCVIIGNQFEYENYSTRQEAIGSLRDSMATLAWELISLKPAVKRKNLTDEYWLAHIRASRKKRAQEYQHIEESYMYRPKGEISIGELLAEMHGIEYSSMSANYQQYRNIEQLIERWTSPITFK